MIKARYTEVLYNLLENEQTKPLIDKALSTYPMYEPKNEMNYSVIPTRSELNKKILDHYKYREIGFETVGRFLEELEISMNEIMPFYNQLYKSVDVMNNLDDLFKNVDVVESFEEETSGKANATSSSSGTSSAESEGTSSSESDITNNNKNVETNTPQNKLTIGTKNIDSVDYADTVKWNEDISHSTGSSSDNSKSESSSSAEGESQNITEGTTKHTLSKKGNQGVNTYAHDLLEFRELAMNIEQRIIHDGRIAELFMNVF